MIIPSTSYIPTCHHSIAKLGQQITVRPSLRTRWWALSYADGTELRAWRKLPTPDGRMFGLGIARLGTLACIALSKVHGSHRVRIFSAAPTRADMAAVTVLVEAKCSHKSSTASRPWATSALHASRWRAEAAAASGCWCT